MITSIVKGLWTAIKTPKLILILWAWNVLLALAAAWPARMWFGTALDTRVETESLLTRFSFATFGDLSKSQELAPFAFLMASAVGVALIALTGNAFMNGGILEAVGNRNDARTFMHRFYRGGGHFFWRFVRLGLVAFVGGAIMTGIVAVAVGAATTPLSDSEWEPAGMFWGLVTLAVSGLVALWFVLALDYARIRVARDGGRGMFRIYVRSLAFVARHVFATYTIAILALTCTAALLVAYIAHEAAWTTSTWAAIGILVAVQQAIMLARTGLRVGQVSAEWFYFGAVTPAPAQAVAPDAAAKSPVAVSSPAADVRPQGDPIQVEGVSGLDIVKDAGTGEGTVAGRGEGQA